MRKEHTTMNYNSTVNQDIKSKFVSREVIYCVSNLVYELAKKAEEFPEYSEDLYGTFEGIPDYEEAAINEGWDIRENGGFINEQINEESDAKTWKELCDEYNIDYWNSDYIPEIYEHWIVTDFLANRLEEHGHKVLRGFFGMTVWCRPTTGQAILLDHVICIVTGKPIVCGCSFTLNASFC